MTDTFDIEAQEKARQAEIEKVRYAMRIEKEDVIWLMSGKRGRRFVYSILERAGVFKLSFDENPLKMSFNEGRRNEGLALMSKLMKYCPKSYTAMLEEQPDD